MAAMPAPTRPSSDPSARLDIKPDASTSTSPGDKSPRQPAEPAAATTVLLIRHGETAWNAERRLQGHLDIGLNRRGLAQAAALGRALAGTCLAAVVASDLQRASATAAAIAASHRLPVHQDEGLRERGYGRFEGLLYAEIAARYPREFAAWQARDIDARMPAGTREAESFRQFSARALAAIGRQAARWPGATIAMVAHGGVLECAYRAATGLALDTPRNFAVHNASINRFTAGAGGLALLSWGETAHLDAATLDELP